MKENRTSLTLSKEFPLLRFPLLEEIPFVGHCFSTREGGVSKGIYQSMNLSFTRGDEDADVHENYRRITAALGVTTEQLVFSDQTHTTNVMRVGKEFCGCGIHREKPYHDVDGLITNEPGVVLTTFYADCVPLYFVDPVHKAIGLSHSGWRGTAGKMGQVTLEAMKREFGTQAKDVYAAIGPSICQACYEISEDVALQFDSRFLIAKGNGKYHLDLWECNKQILIEAGVLEEKIAVTDLCTCCNSKLLFSHRASEGKRGNLAAFLFIKE